MAHDESESEGEACLSDESTDRDVAVSHSDSDGDGRAPKRKDTDGPDVAASLKRCRIAVSPGELRLRSDLASFEQLAQILTTTDKWEYVRRATRAATRPRANAPRKIARRSARVAQRAVRARTSA